MTRSLRAASAASLSSLLLGASLALSACVVGDGDSEPADEGAPPADYLPAPAALTWPNVRLGDTGANVTALQQLLVARGQATPTDGAFRAETDAAVRAFQAASGLTADGIAGRNTWEKLVVQLAAGDRGPAVAALHGLLVARAGATVDPGDELGAATMASLQDLQRKRCLGAGATVGLYTWNALVADTTFCVAENPAANILAAHRAAKLTLWNQTFGRFDGADPLSNITAAAAGRAAKTSCYGGAPCASVRLARPLLDAMDALRTRYGFRYFVTAIAGSSHAPNSYHYVGRAFDVDEVNGVRINGDSATARAWMAACRALGAVEVFGPSNDPSHWDHLHCAF